jgi:hypothetical protein
MVSFSRPHMSASTMRRSEPERIVRLLLLIPKTFLTVSFSKHGERREETASPSAHGPRR